MKEYSINWCDCRIKMIQKNLDKSRSMIHDYKHFHVSKDYKKTFIKTFIKVFFMLY